MSLHMNKRDRIYEKSALTERLEDWDTYNLGAHISVYNFVERK